MPPLRTKGIRPVYILPPPPTRRVFAVWSTNLSLLFPSRISQPLISAHGQSVFPAIHNTYPAHAATLRPRAGAIHVPRLCG